MGPTTKSLTGEQMRTTREHERTTVIVAGSYQPCSDSASNRAIAGQRRTFARGYKSKEDEAGFLHTVQG